MNAVEDEVLMQVSDYQLLRKNTASLLVFLATIVCPLLDEGIL